MKFSSTHFQRKPDEYGKTERCKNMGKPSSLLLSSLVTATVFTFFLINSPNPFRIMPHHGLESLHPPQNLDQIPVLQNKSLPSVQSHHPDFDNKTIVAKHGISRNLDDGNIKERPLNEDKEEECDLFKGHWVRELRGSNMYSNSSCTTIPDSKNCLRHGRLDMDFLNWRWKPDKCELPRFDSKIFLDNFRGKKIAFVGDSVSRNHVESLLCLLSQEEIPEDVYKDSEDRFRKWYFPKHELTLIMLWSKFLIIGRERIINGTGSGIFDLHLDKIDENWARHLPGIDYALISDGHWFFRVLYLHENEKITGCVYCNEPNLPNHNTNYPLKMAFRRVFKHINECKNCSDGLVTLVRTFSPAHFEKGAWNTGGYCNRTSPLGEEEVDLGSFDWELRKVQVEEMESARKEGEKRGKRFGVVDITKAMMMRADGHPGAFWGNKWMKGYNDCVHWCLPGPIDVWNDFLMEVLRRQAGSS